MKTLNALVLILFFQPFFCLAQTRTITCKVIDSESQEPIYNAAVVVDGSIRKTFTNPHGFFRVELAKGNDELVIYHVGYETGKIKLPKVDKFSIKLNPSKLGLSTLLLNDYPDTTKSSPNPSNIEQPNNQKIIEQNAAYHGGWDEFYNDLGNLITLDNTFQRNNFEAELEFRINTNGSIDRIEISPDTIINNEVIINSISGLNGWKPAIQNNMPCNQLFSLRINYVGTPGDLRTYNEKITNVQSELVKFYKSTGTELRYPQQARRMGIEGKVFVKFTVQKDGLIADAEIIKGIGAGCDEEVLRILSKAPKWDTPYPFDEPLILPITFSLGNKKTFNNSLPANHPELLPEIDVVALGVGPNRLAIGSGSDRQTFGLGDRTSIIQPEFPGGQKQFEAYIKKNKKTINDKLPLNRFGDNVKLEFTVDRNGQIENITVLQSLGEKFDKEAIRLHLDMPRLIPASKNGESIEMKQTATIYFGVVSVAKIKSAYASFIRGNGLLEKGKYEKAINHFAKAIEGHPSQLDYYFNRANAYLKLENIEKFCEDMEIIKDYDQEALDIYNEKCGK